MVRVFPIVVNLSLVEARYWQKKAGVKAEWRRYGMYFVPDGTCLQLPKHPTAILSLRDITDRKLTTMVSSRTIPTTDFL
jgi:hypothetical protein